MIWRSILLLLLAVVPAAASDVDVSADGSAAGLPSDAVLEARGAVIGDVFVVTEDVFDPDHPREDNRIYRFTNRLHRTTRPGVIRHQLLFREGDPFSRQALVESERLLRQNRYLYDAEIRIVGYRHNRVDVEVRTRDVWTLNPGASVGRSGGVNSTVFKLQDKNLWGLGLDLTFKRTSDVDRDTFLVRFEDKNVLGSRVAVKLQYEDSSDGSKRFIDARQPFYSLDSRFTAGFRVLEDQRIDPLYSLGQAVDVFGHDETVVEVDGGLSRGLKDGRARRFRFGATFEEHRFGPIGGLTIDGVPVPSPLVVQGKAGWALSKTELDLMPPDRTLVYPWIGFDSLTNDYAEAHSLDQMGRTEDLELGHRFQARLGWASRSLGSDVDAAVFDTRVSDGLRSADGTTLLWRAGASGRWGKDGAEDVRVGGEARFYWRNFGEHLFFVKAEADAVHELDPEDQLLLGGDSGLRGYPLRYQDGEERFLLSLEQRFFTGFYPFRLAYVGAAVFFDVGRTWGDGVVPGQGRGWLKDVGFGLRLSSSRSGLGSVIHFDVAFPLDGDASIDSVQFLVETKASF